MKLRPNNFHPRWMILTGRSPRDEVLEGELEIRLAGLRPWARRREEDGRRDGTDGGAAPPDVLLDPVE
jgi:hypothetical protein